VNRLLGEERVVVFDQPGTTRDSVYIDYEREGQKYTLIDTAGVRKRKNVKETVEKFSIVKTLKAIDDAHVVILLMDGHEGIVDQDMHLLGHCIDAGRGLVLAVLSKVGIRASNLHCDLQKLAEEFGIPSRAGNVVVGIRDVPVMTGKPGERPPLFTHTKYWDLGDAETPPDHVVALREALDLARDRA